MGALVTEHIFAVAYYIYSIAFQWYNNSAKAALQHFDKL